MPELQQPDIAGNFLSSYYTAQQKQQADADRQRNMQRQDQGDEMARQAHALKVGQEVYDMLGNVADGDAVGFERAKQRWTQMGLPPEAVAGFTAADLPMLRQKAGTQLRELQLKNAQLAPQLTQAQIDAQRANINQSNAAAAASYAQTDFIKSGKGQFEKPLPQGAVKFENDTLPQIQAAQNNTYDVKKYSDMIKKGELDPNFLKNEFNSAKSFFGSVDENDVRAINYNTFMSDMKRLRAESLRLNVGPQTDKDAEREWETLFTNMNDKNVVAAQLDRIAAINTRAARQKAALVRNNRKSVMRGKYQEPSWSDLGIDESFTGTPQNTGATEYVFENGKLVPKK